MGNRAKQAELRMLQRAFVRELTGKIEGGAKALGISQFQLETELGYGSADGSTWSHLKSERRAGTPSVHKLGSLLRRAHERGYIDQQNFWLLESQLLGYEEPDPRYTRGRRKALSKIVPIDRLVIEDLLVEVDPEIEDRDDEWMQASIDMVRPAIEKLVEAYRLANRSEFGDAAFRVFVGRMLAAAD